MAKLYFYYSAMNAGKTTTLLQSSYNYQERGMETLLLTPQADNRYSKEKIVSRIGLEANAHVFAPDTDLRKLCEKYLTENKNIKCILVDESQFLTKTQVKQLCYIPDYMKTPVLCYGLRSDFQGELFEGSKTLLALADELIEIKTICHCGSKATMNMRIDEHGKKVEAGNQVEIGGNDRYIAVCRKHLGMKESSPTTTTTKGLATEVE